MEEATNIDNKTEIFVKLVWVLSKNFTWKRISVETTFHEIISTSGKIEEWKIPGNRSEGKLVHVFFRGIELYGIWFEYCQIIFREFILWIAIMRNAKGVGVLKPTIFNKGLKCLIEQGILTKKMER